MNTVTGWKCKECGVTVGPILWEHPETGHDRAGWVLCFYHDDSTTAAPSTPAPCSTFRTYLEGLLCEDCWGLAEGRGA